MGAMLIKVMGGVALNNGSIKTFKGRVQKKNMEIP